MATGQLFTENNLMLDGDRQIPQYNYDPHIIKVNLKGNGRIISAVYLT